jgi:PAS domain S-box-containing protein
VANDLRKSGIGTVGDIPWGTHFCYFYENKEDLLDVLIPYFKTGLEQKEFCVWGVFDPLDEQEARDAVERAMPGAGLRFAAGDIEIVPQSQWYRGDGVHGLQQLVRDWEAKLGKALTRGCAGMRVNVSEAWLVEKDRGNLDAYEDGFSGLIANRRMILLCAYPLPVDRAAEIFDAGYTHRFAIARRDGTWQLVATPELRQSRVEVKRLDAELERRAIERTEELATADKDRRQEAGARHLAEQALRASEERSRCYFELGLVGMAIVSPTKGWVEVNDRLCDILGYGRAELMQMTWAALSHPDDLAGDIRNYDRIFAGEVDGCLMAKRWIRKNGDVVHTNVSVKCQRREDGSVSFFAAMIEEVTGPDQLAGQEAAAAGRARPDLEGGDGLPDHKDLSGREREVARLIGLGNTVKEVAAALALSEKTVSTYRSRILTKLNLNSTAELIRYAIKNRLSE